MFSKVILSFLQIGFFRLIKLCQNKAAFKRRFRPLRFVTGFVIYDVSHTEYASDLDYLDEMIIFESLWTTFKSSSIFWGSVGNSQNWLESKIELSNQVKLVQIPDTLWTKTNLLYLHKETQARSIICRTFYVWRFEFEHIGTSPHFEILQVSISASQPVCRGIFLVVQPNLKIS